MSVCPTDRKDSGTPAVSTTKLIPWFAGLSLVAFAVGAHLGRPASLSAMGGSLANLDTDLDGFSDVHEAVLRLSPDAADTDGDGFSDVEEITRGSNPKSSASSPEKEFVALDVSGYAENGTMHIVTSVYLKGGLGSGHRFQIGAFHKGDVYILSPSTYLPFTEVTRVRGNSPTDLVYLLDMKLPQRLITDLGEVTFFVRTKPTNNEEFPKLASMAIQTSGGIPFEVSPLPTPTSTGAQPNHPRLERPSIYTPLVPSTSLQGRYSSGQVCVQSSRVAGSGGQGLELEVVEAGCVDGDGICPSSCATTVGESAHVMDPIVLIGG